MRMSEIYQNFFLNLGAVGAMVIGLVWFSQKLFRDLIDDANYLRKENKILETEFRKYLQDQSKEHHEVIKQISEVIKQNTTAYNNFSRVFEKFITDK
jgi:gas vesicle protein